MPPDSRNEDDPVFGPPASMGRFGTANRQCRRCEVWWLSDNENDEENCWVCGAEGEVGYKGFAGSSTSYPDEPPRHMWTELGWTGTLEEAS